MIKWAKSHLSANIFAHGDQRNAKDCKRLKLVVFLCSVDMVITQVKHMLDLKNISSSYLNEK